MGQGVMYFLERVEQTARYHCNFEHPMYLIEIKGRVSRVERTPGMSRQIMPPYFAV